jgi:hypothetical protein
MDSSLKTNWLAFAVAGRGRLLLSINRNRILCAASMFDVLSFEHTFCQLILDLLKPMEEHTEDAKIDEEAARLPVSLDISISIPILTRMTIRSKSLCMQALYRMLYYASCNVRSIQTTENGHSIKI